MLYQVIVYEPEEGFCVCIGEYEKKEEAEMHAEEARTARRLRYPYTYKLIAWIEAHND